MKALGVVYLLWAERPTRDGKFEGDQGVLIGIYADIQSARDMASAYRQNKTKGQLSIVEEKVMGL